MNTPMTPSAKSFEQVRDEIVALLKKGADIPAELQTMAEGHMKERLPAFLPLAKAMLAKYHKAPLPLRAGAAAALLAYLTNAKA